MGGAENDEDDKDDADDAAGKDTHDEAAGLAPVAGPEPPQVGEKVLRSGDDGHQEAVAGKPDVVDLDRGRQAFVATVILFADEGRVEEDEVGDEVCKEAFFGGGFVRNFLFFPINRQASRNQGEIPNEFKKGKSAVDPDVDFRLQFSNDCG